ncbi:hypothetical protein [Flavivirga sp. 57AJ16]|uniref:hypothetical protein n=1 Tax=Flavivirga sp. 57AJ16 TaxID=3025307 RepID=UPI0023650C8F|nr:hypothetical protein [Flavivirga sp. 57AJ16]MDD7886378.1 hypothetical protein [Flavivirga sp. 57AJ16]
MSIDLNTLPDQIEVPDFESLEVAKNNTATLNLHLKEAEIQRFLKDTTLRTNLVYIFSAIIVLWLASVIIIVFLNNSFVCLSDNVIIALLTTTTINVIGMMLIILRNLFPQIKNGEIK